MLNDEAVDAAVPEPHLRDARSLDAVTSIENLHVFAARKTLPSQPPRESFGPYSNAWSSLHILTSFFITGLLLPAKYILRRISQHTPCHLAADSKRFEVEV